MIQSLILLVILIFLNAIFASAEIAVISVNEAKLKKMAEDERFCVPGVPAEYLQNHIAGAFVETVRWWTERDCAMPPEELCRCFLALLPPMSPAPAAK